MNVNCKNCGLPIEITWPGMWFHPTIEKEVNIDGADVMLCVTDCPDDLGEAEPDLGLMGSSSIPYSCLV